MRQGLPFELFLGLRYLRSRGQRTNLSLFAWIGVGGVFLGVGALIVVLAVMTGFQDGIRDKIIAGSPHLLVFQSGGQGLVGADAVAGQIQKVAGVRSATPFVHQQVLFTTATGGARGGLIRGVDLNTPAVLADVRSQLRGGTLEPLVEGAPMILLGRELARSLGVLPGDPVTVISPEGAAAILWRSATEAEKAANALKLAASDLLRLGIVDGLIPEPAGGAHTDPQATIAAIKSALTVQLDRLGRVPIADLLSARYERYRHIGTVIEPLPGSVPVKKNEPFWKRMMRPT